MPDQVSRRGRMVFRGRNGSSKAVFVSGSAAGPTFFDPEPIAEKLSLWWQDGAGDKFQLKIGDDWTEWPKGMILNLMRSECNVFARSREGEVISEANKVLLHVMQSRRVSIVLNALAGYRAGIHDLCGQRILVKTSARLIEPKEGDFSTITAFIDAKLNLAGGLNQANYFHAWLKTAIESLYQSGPGNFRPGQAIVFAGPRDCGKSRLQHQIVTGLLGGRSANPEPYLFGRTDFNAELVGAEHLLLEDPASSTAMKQRIFFGEMLKQVIVNDTQRLHRKGIDALTVAPFFRATISVNDDPDKLRVLPPLTPDLKDKVMLFRVAAGPLPLPTATIEERTSFRARIDAELPAYAWHLLHVFEIPMSMKSIRFGVRAWLHPELARQLFDDSPAGEFLNLLDSARWNGKALWEREDAQDDCWQGGADQLERLLEISTVRNLTIKLLRYHSLNRLLARLSEDQPGRVAHHRDNVHRFWRIRAGDS